MAHHKSAKKRIRRTETRTAVNGARRSRVRTYIRKVEEAIASGDQASAREALRQAQPEMARAVSRGAFKANTISRKISRLSARVKGMSA
jgi:small subunit ribosomal protein S20